MLDSFQSAAKQDVFILARDSQRLYFVPSHTAAWVRIPSWACEKVTSDLGLGGGFRRVLRFPPLFTTGLIVTKYGYKCQ